MFYLLIGCNVAIAAVFLYRMGGLPPQIPLYFSRPWGEEQLADTWMIFLLPIIMNTLFFVNKAIYHRFFAGNEFVSKIITYVTLFICVSITFIFIKIIFLIS